MEEVFENVSKSVDSVSIPNGIFVLKNIQFKTGSSEIEAASYGELDKLAGALLAHPSVFIEIRGHTDDIGRAEDNLKLSHNRALSVLAYLEQKGVNLKEQL